MTTRISEEGAPVGGRRLRDMGAARFVTAAVIIATTASAAVAVTVFGSGKSRAALGDLTCSGVANAPHTLTLSPGLTNTAKNHSVSASGIPLSCTTLSHGVPANLAGTVSGSGSGEGDCTGTPSGAATGTTTVTWTDSIGGTSSGSLGFTSSLDPKTGQFSFNYSPFKITGGTRFVGDTVTIVAVAVPVLAPGQTFSSACASSAGITQFAVHTESVTAG